MKEKTTAERPDLSQFSQKVEQLRANMAQVLVGQQNTVDLMLVALLARGHVLLEGVPGVAKTLSAKLLARSLQLDFNRLQFTPDLMPSDVLGTSVYNMQEARFVFKPGPVFSQVVLVDEINRAPAKTQAALFEVMEEGQVTIDGHTHVMREPYLVLATQNPIEQEGTYRLPEAQLDRFFLKVRVDYPQLEEEVEILQRHAHWSGQPLAAVKAVLDEQSIRQLQAQLPQIRVEKSLLHYIAALVEATRHDPSLYLGASPRASIALMQGARAYAALQGRDYVTPDDVKYLAEPVLAHRVILSPEREIEGLSLGEVVAQLLTRIEVPR